MLNFAIICNYYSLSEGERQQKKKKTLCNYWSRAVVQLVEHSTSDNRRLIFDYNYLICPNKCNGLLQSINSWQQWEDYEKRFVSRIDPSLLPKIILYNSWTLQLTNYIQKIIKGPA